MRISTLILISLQMLTGLAVQAETLPKAVCPAGISAKKGDAPLLSVDANEKFTLMVCGHKEAQGKVKIHLSEFEILSSDATEKNVVIDTGKADQDFRIWDDNHHMMVDEVVWFSGGWTPIFHSEITCTDQTCTKSVPKCAFDKESAIKHQAQRELKIPDADTSVKTQDPSLLDSVSDSALAGSDRALQFFMNPSKTMHLSKESQKRFNHTQALLKRLLAAKCL